MIGRGFDGERMPPDVTLSYPTNDAGLESPWTRVVRFRRVPGWVVSFVLLAGFLAFTAWHVNHFAMLPYGWLEWFSPGPPASAAVGLLGAVAIQRRGWVRTGLAVASAAGIVLLSRWLHSLPDQRAFDSWKYVAVVRFLTLVMAGWIWGFSMTRRGWAGALRGLFLASGLAFLGWMLDVAQAAAGAFHFWPDAWNIPFAVEANVEPFVLAGVFWLTARKVVAEWRGSAADGRRWEIVSGVGTAIVATGSWWFVWTGQVGLVTWFLPYDAPGGAQMSHLHYLQSEHISDERLMSMLERADWGVPPTYHGPGVSS